MGRPPLSSTASNPPAGLAGLRPQRTNFLSAPHGCAWSKPPAPPALISTEVLSLPTLVPHKPQSKDIRIQPVTIHLSSVSPMLLGAKAQVLVEATLHWPILPGHTRLQDTLHCFHLKTFKARDFLLSFVLFRLYPRYSRPRLGPRRALSWSDE